jgi:hypothetical protein
LRFAASLANMDGAMRRSRTIATLTAVTLALIAVAALALVASAKRASVAAHKSYVEECGVNPSTESLTDHFVRLARERGDSDDEIRGLKEELSPPNRADVIDSHFTEDDHPTEAEKEAAWQEALADWGNYIASLEKVKARHQTEYNECVADMKRREAADKRTKAEARAAARLRCADYRAAGVRIRIRKSRPGVPCSLARELARLTRSNRQHAGWRRTSFERGYDGSKLVTVEDARTRELRTYRVPTLPFMHATWRKGALRVVVESGYFCERVC